jgi:hypothetical protein
MKYILQIFPLVLLFASLIMSRFVHAQLAQSLVKLWKIADWGFKTAIFGFSVVIYFDEIQIGSFILFLGICISGIMLLVMNFKSKSG